MVDKIFPIIWTIWSNLIAKFFNGNSNKQIKD